MRKIAAVVVGAVLGWVVLGSGLAVGVDAVAGTGLDDDQRGLAYGLCALMGLAFGAAIGHQIASPGGRRQRSAGPAVGGVVGAGLARRRNPSTPGRVYSLAPKPSTAEAALTDEESRRAERLLDLYAEGEITRAEFDAARARGAKTQGPGETSTAGS